MLFHMDFHPDMLETEYMWLSIVSKYNHYSPDAAGQTMDYVS